MKYITTDQAILELLIRGANYGLGLQRDLEAHFQMSVGPGTLYPSLRRLEREGFVSSRKGESTAARRGRPRIYYKLTAKGQAAALEQQSEFRDFVAAFLPNGSEA